MELSTATRPGVRSGTTRTVVELRGIQGESVLRTGAEGAERDAGAAGHEQALAVRCGKQQAGTAPLGPAHRIETPPSLGAPPGRTLIKHVRAQDSCWGSR
jgi:hypothetical protein